MRPTLSQCFPHPLTRQWPSTSNSVSCECQQLYALVCICCCLPKTHLLVLHEGESNNMVTSMPKGPKYVDYRVTPRTTAEDLSSFLYRAELAASQAQQQQQQSQTDIFSDGGGGQRSVHSSPASSMTLMGGAGGSADDALFSPASPFSAILETTLMLPKDSGSAGVSHNVKLRRQVVVVCLHGIAVAPPAVRSVLMDVLSFAQVPYSRGAKAIPSLRIIAFCDYRACISILPETLRASFALSTFMSALSMDSAVVLQSTDPRMSNVVNRSNMQEVMNSTDGLALVDTVVLSSAVSRYMRHLFMTIQGSTLTELAPASMMIRRTTFFYRLLKVAALLFMPEDELFLRRANPRAGYRGVDSDRNVSWGGGGGYSSPQASSYYSANNRDYSSHASPMLGGAGNGPAAIAFAANKTDDGHILSFSHVIVSPSDVICLIPAMVTHHLSLQRAVADVESRVAATRAAMAGLGVPLLSDFSSRAERSSNSHYQDVTAHFLVNRRGAANVVCEDGTAGCPFPGLWDARMASLALARRPHTSVVDATVASRARRQQLETSESQLLSPGSGDAAAAPPTVSNSGLRGVGGGAGNSPPRHRHARGLLSPPTPAALGEAWRGTEARSALASIHVDESDFLYHDYLNYCELRDVVRATLVCRTRPAPA